MNQQDDDIKVLFNTFLGRKFIESGNDYNDKIKQMSEDGVRRLIVNLNDFISFDREKNHYNRLLKEPHLYIPIFESCLKSQLDTISGTKNECFIGFTGSFGANKVSPRQLNTSIISNLVCVEGIVTKMSQVQPKMVKSVHYCPKTKEFFSFNHHDEYSLKRNFNISKYPKDDGKGNLIQTEFGLSEFKDSQTITVQEMPERAPPGQLPRSVLVVVENDLVDLIKPGDRIRVTGIYIARTLQTAGLSSAKVICETFLLGNNIELLGKEAQGISITPEDIRNIKALSKDPQIFELLSQSLAPSIYGHNYIKKAILLQLLGGVERDLKGSGIHLRGDINCLLVGDPGTAKSQILRFVLYVAPLCVSTTGRGASGVGLTAAVVHDKETKERRLEAGAMVLADRGIVCIDEFDKMSPDDRVSIHEVMEQQTVTIAKAGIHASLNARCSVLGAANPIFGKYDQNRSATENIALPDSLLSRFDLLFVILDSIDPQNDLSIAEHVIRMHRYHTPLSSEGLSSASAADSLIVDNNNNNNNESSDLMGEKAVPIYLTFDKLLHVNKERKILSIPFIKRYLHYAKVRIKPVLTDEAQNKIADAFEDLRRRENSKTLPITARTLETIIRLTVAHAKCRLSNYATEDDVDVALGILRYVLYNDNVNSNNNMDLTKQTSQKDTNTNDKGNFSKKKRLSNHENDDDDSTAPGNESIKKRKSNSNTSSLSRKRIFEKSVILAFKEDDSADLASILDSLISLETTDEHFTMQELIEHSRKMESQGKLILIEEEKRILKI